MSKAISFLEELRSNLLYEHSYIIDYVWKNKESYFVWPEKSLLFKPDATRLTKYHKYSDSEKELLCSLNINPDTRCNGPAIMSFLVAGGTRPTREDGKGWTVHHIYDGRFTHPLKSSTSHAVKDPNLFTESAGLVAVHPIADALADEFAYVAWLLRYEAFIRFKFDPDNVFHDS